MTTHICGSLLESVRVVVSMAILIAGASVASAQTAANDAANAPDKSRYTLFDPTPNDELRSFCTDRPPKANLPCTVDAGHFQYESDIFNWTNSQSGSVAKSWLRLSEQFSVSDKWGPAGFLGLRNFARWA